jgi:hypothetical protein
MTNSAHNLYHHTNTTIFLAFNLKPDFNLITFKKYLMEDILISLLACLICSILVRLGFGKSYFGCELNTYVVSISSIWKAVLIQLLAAATKTLFLES